MICFPNCKINLGLKIISKRADGFHNIETVFFPVPLRDALELIVVRDATVASDVEFTSGGLSIPGEQDSNLCVKAYRLLKDDFPALPSFKIHLLKAIPMGAGLGGGSADGAFTLKALNELFSLGLTQGQLITYAMKLGSDCPFFIINKPCIGTGRGEKLEAISVNLNDFDLVLVNPGIHINTGWAFSQISHIPDAPHQPSPSPRELINLPVAQWRDVLTNDFEAPVFAAHPKLAEIRNSLYTNGAVYSSMTGSGSSVFGLFPRNVKTLPDFPLEYLVKRLKL